MATRIHIVSGKRILEHATYIWRSQKHMNCEMQKRKHVKTAMLLYEQASMLAEKQKTEEAKASRPLGSVQSEIRVLSIG